MVGRETDRKSHWIRALYLAEFTFRHNNRGNPDLFMELLWSQSASPTIRGLDDLWEHPQMAEHDLAKALQAQRKERLSTFGGPLRMLVRFLNRMNVEEREEYERIGKAIAEQNESFNNAMTELEPLADESATIEQNAEYMSRMTALRERDLEVLTRLAGDYRELQSRVVARVVK